MKEYEYRVSAAGRINLIGEHIDYCGGKVMPAAISLKNTVYIRPNGTNQINLTWTTLPDKVTLDIDTLKREDLIRIAESEKKCLLSKLEKLNVILKNLNLSV